ncbi:MAG: hypothetical protein J6S43_00520 [Lentisphaeria bacterium]|nr:hypothetical protein [Lentisphaeria bacterium]
MLEITNLRDGAVLDHRSGCETDDYLEITVEGIADPQSAVKVNDIAALRHDRNFSAKVRLTEKINRITVVSDDYFGVKTLTITVLWDKKSFPRYNFFFDDCIFALRSVAKNRPASVFDEMFLGRLKKINSLYGTKFILNLFYNDDHHKDFNLSDMPDTYKTEFQANADWLRFSFHAYSEFPDRPYQNASKEKLAADFDLICDEVCRFDGKECFIAPQVIHWAMTNPENFSVLKDRGVKFLSGGFLGCKTSLTEEHSVQVTDIAYHYEKDVAYYVCDKAVMYDRYYDLLLMPGMVCCNFDDIPTLEKKFAALAAAPRDVVCLMTHEQYSYPDYFNYIPDHLDRIEAACRLAYEAGLKPTWLSYGVFGNESWGK